MAKQVGKYLFKSAWPKIVYVNTYHLAILPNFGAVSAAAVNCIAAVLSRGIAARVRVDVVKSR